MNILNQKRANKKTSNPFSKNGNNPADIIISSLGSCWLIGGALRDAFLKKKFSDLDIVLEPSANLKQKIISLAKKLNASAFEMDAENHVWRLTGHGDSHFQIDILPFQGKTLQEDIMRRDFTANALALKLEPDTPLKYLPEKSLFSLRLQKKKLIDLCGGIKDLQAGRLAMVSDNIFREDPLRMLRAYRLAASHGLKISPKTLRMIKRDARLIKNSAGERIREELMKIFAREDSCAYIKKMNSSGLLFEIFPELAAQPGCATDYYGKGGVLKHTLTVLERTDLLFARIKEFCPSYKKLANYIDLKQPAIYKLTALLHDVAKPAKAAMIGERLRFFGHEECGAKMARAILERLHFSKEDIKLITSVIGSHLRPGNLAVNTVISERAMFRLFRAMGNALMPLLILCWADYASYITLARLEKTKSVLPKMPDETDVTKLPYNSPKKTMRFMQAIYMLARTYMEKSPQLSGKTLADGNDIMRELKIKPGPEIGIILEQMKMLQFEGKIKSRQEALLWLKNMAGKKNKHSIKKSKTRKI